MALGDPLTKLAIRLEDETHRAFCGDREVMRLTTALSLAGLVNEEWFTDEGKRRGRAVHEAILGDYEGGLIEQWIDPAYLPYWHGYMAFQRETRFEPLACEQVIFDGTAWYAGQFDLFGRLPDLSLAAWDLIDVKTGRAPTWVGLQTMGYRRRVVHPHTGELVARCRRWALELPGNGRYRLVPLNLDEAGQRIDVRIDGRHERVLLAAITVANWKRGWL